MAIISFLGFVRKIHRKCLSPGANLRETACLSLQGAVIRRQPQAHQFYCTKTGGETATWLSSYGTIILCPELQRSCQPLFVPQPLLIKCTSWNNSNLISFLQLTLSATKYWSGEWTLFTIRSLSSIVRINVFYVVANISSEYHPRKKGQWK